MNTTENLLTRRSIRQYKNVPVPDSCFENILRAAMYAPSAMNLQPWEFVVMNSKESIALCKESVTHGEAILSQSPAAILVCGDNRAEPNVDYLVQNCSAAVQNILLQVHEEGLGGCWIAVFPLQDVIDRLKKNFSLPQHILPIALISLGYPAEEKSAEERYKKEKVHYNIWK